MNFLRNACLAALVALPVLVVGGGACTLTVPGGPGVGGGGTVIVGGDCISDLDCAVGDYCDWATGLCAAEGTVVIGDACYSDLDCLDGDYCSYDGLCVAGVSTVDVVVGDECYYDDECLSGYCDAGICADDTYVVGYGGPGDPCYGDIDCAEPYYCDDYSDTCE